MSFQFKSNGLYICNLIDADFRSEGIFVKNYIPHLTDNVFNLGGVPVASMNDMKKAIFFISFFENNGVVTTAQFGFSWMESIHAVDTFLGNSETSRSEFDINKGNVKIDGSFADFDCYYEFELFEIECELCYESSIGKMIDPILVANITNKETGKSVNYLPFRFIPSISEKIAKRREYIL